MRNVGSTLKIKRVIIAVFGLIATFVLSACNIKATYTDATVSAALSSSTTPTISDIYLSDSTMTITGSGLSKVTSATIINGGTTYSLTVLNANETTVFAYTASTIRLALATVYNLIISSADASTSATFTYNLNVVPTNGLTVGVNQLVTANSHVGIGTVNPLFPLDVVGTLRAAGSASTPDISTYLFPGNSLSGYKQGLGMNLYFNGAEWATVGDGASANGGQAILGDYVSTHPDSPADGLHFYAIAPTGGSSQTIPETGSCGSSSQPINCYERMLITNAGQVEIDPPALNAGDLSSNALTFAGTTVGISSKQTVSGNQYGLDFYTSSTARVSITSAGNVGVGTTSPASTLAVNGEIDAMGSSSATSTPPTLSATTGWKIGLYSSTYAIGITGSTLALASAGWLSLFSGATNNNATGVAPDTAAKVTLGVDGSIWSGSTKICTAAGCTASSDERLKEDITPLSNSNSDALSKVLKLRGVSYFWKDKSMGEGPQMGLIAQEVEKVFPEVVSVTNPREGLKSVAYDHLVAPVIESIKEFYRKFLALNDRVQSLESKNAALINENIQIKTYLCAKDPAAPLCKSR